MDKSEYKIRAAEIKDLLDQHQFVKAMEVCDLIDWKRVKNISMLCKVSEIYKVNRKYEEAKDILLIAYDRYPNGKMIIYNLCELYIKIGDIVQAWECYKEFVTIAPKDSAAFILQYKLYEAQEVSIEERIEVLQKYKEKEYHEKWAYELAYLYHRIGQETNCVEECDELILWFGDGKYVKKALELKQLHQPLSPNQQEKYDSMVGIVRKETVEPEIEEETAEEVVEENLSNEEPVIPEVPQTTIHTGETIEIAPVNVDKFSTMNLQAELSKSMLEVMEEPVVAEVTDNNMVEEEIPVYDEVVSTYSEPVIPSPEFSEEAALPDQQYIEMEQVPEEEMEMTPSPEGFESAIDKTQNMGEPLINTMLSQGSDGQISLVVPEEKEVEKQITGQMDFTEVMKEWDRLRNAGNEERISAAKRKSLEQTSDIVSQLQEVLPGIGTSPLPQIDSVNEEDYMSTEDLPSEKDILSALNDTETEDSETVEPSEETEAVEEELEETEEIKETEETEEIEEIEETEESEEEDVEEEEDDSEDTDEEEDLNPSIEEEILENFGEFLKLRKMKSSIREVLRKARMMGNTGNLIITGNEPSVRVRFALAVAKSIQDTDPDFIGKLAKIDAQTLNNKDAGMAVKKLQGGALIIENAGELNINTMDAMIKAVNNPDARLLFILEDEKNNIRKIQKLRDYVDKVFNISVNIPTYSNNDLVEHAKNYALEREYSIDDMGMLALYKRIDELQTASHYVTIAEVEDIMEDAIDNADKKNMAHLMDILFARRYDDNDLIILKEKDFLRK